MKNVKKQVRSIFPLWIFVYFGFFFSPKWSIPTYFVNFTFHFYSKILWTWFLFLLYLFLQDFHCGPSLYRKKYIEKQKLQAVTFQCFNTLNLLVVSLHPLLYWKTWVESYSFFYSSDFVAVRWILRIYFLEHNKYQISSLWHATNINIINKVFWTIFWVWSPWSQLSILHSQHTLINSVPFQMPESHTWLWLPYWTTGTQCFRSALIWSPVLWVLVRWPGSLCLNGPSGSFCHIKGSGLDFWKS